jgi:hypothetical protein
VRKVRRPMRPNPLIAILVVIEVSFEVDRSEMSRGL